jgi:hypothetical protein
MKRFFLFITLIVFISLTIGEVVSRCLSLKNRTIDLRNYNSNPGQSIYHPNKDGYFVFGQLPFIHKTKFTLNDIGFNTPLDFKQFDEDKINVSFIGDSFVEGFHVDVTHNFSSILMKKSKRIQSFDFGCSNFNAINYSEVYKYHEMERFDYVFIVLDMTDLKYENPLRLARKKYSKIYTYIHLINFLDKGGNILRFFNLIHFNTLNVSKELKLDSRVKELIKKKNVHVIVRDSKSLNYLKSRNFHNIIEILHDKKPVNFGTSELHYNLNGRENVINSIISHLKITQ